MDADESSITLSLISHTNVGKTTLARTLLRKDIGEVADQAHVTDQAESHSMLEADGRRLRLWDTPGFGDTARLVRRLRASGNPIGWFLSQVWDRFADRPLWCSQQAARNVKQEAEVVLYLVNASERPEDAGYVPMEMEILSWIGKPVVVLLNQTGGARAREQEEGDVAAWNRLTSRYAVVKDVIALDAFARCWVQESVLLERVAPLVRASKQAAFQALATEWRSRNVSIFHDSMQALSAHLSETAADYEALPQGAWSDSIRKLIPFAGKAGRGEEVNRKEEAMSKLAERLDARVGALMARLLERHALKGDDGREVERRLKESFDAEEPVNAGLMSLLGGFFSGAAGGLLADLASGGLSFGGGTVVGGFLGAAGGAGLAKGYNLAKGRTAPCIRWSPDFLEGLLRAGLIRYLAVAHFGRGRGDYRNEEHPIYWKERVEEAVARRRDEFRAHLEKAGADAEAARRVLNPFCASMAEDLLTARYPEAADLFRG